MGGETYNESVPFNCQYSDFMYKLTEKFDSAVSVKYLTPGEELEPDSLAIVADDSDLKVRSVHDCRPH